MTRPNHEGIAELNLERQGYAHYCPRFLLEKPGKAAVSRPLFPRYIFILINQTWSSICGTRGISRVLLGDNGPLLLAEHYITELQGRSKHGFVQLGRVEQFKPGAAVRQGTGPFAGHALIYQGMSPHDRVRVLADMLGQKVLVELDEKTLVAA